MIHFSRQRLYPFQPGYFSITSVCASINNEFRDNIVFMLSVIVINSSIHFRPEVIAVLQVVRNDRNGDMNISLTDLMKDAERLLTKKGNVLKPASLTARARVRIYFTTQ